MKRLIILVAFLFMTSAQADSDWYKENKDLGLELNKLNLKTVVTLAKIESRKCLRFLQYADAHDFHLRMTEWKNKCYASRLTGNTLANWQDADAEKFMKVARLLEKDLYFVHDLTEYMGNTVAITNKMKINTIIMKSNRQ